MLTRTCLFKIIPLPVLFLSRNPYSETWELQQDPEYVKEVVFLATRHHVGTDPTNVEGYQPQAMKTFHEFNDEFEAITNKQFTVKLLASTGSDALTLLSGSLAQQRWTARLNKNKFVMPYDEQHNKEPWLLYEDAEQQPKEVEGISKMPRKVLVLVTT